MLFPKKVKYRKWQRMRRGASKRGQPATKGTIVAFGSCGLKSEEAGEISANQIEAARRALTRTVQKTGKLWIRVFPDKPITKKPPEVGMGKGKGDPTGYVAEIKPGRIIFELDGVARDVAKEAFRKAGSKLSVKTRFVAR